MGGYSVSLVLPSDSTHAWRLNSNIVFQLEEFRLHEWKHFLDVWISSPPSTLLGIRRAKLSFNLEEFRLLAVEKAIALSLLCLKQIFAP